jgi:molybdopterin-guanine dinucleotide biosynthesis protein A
MTHATPRIAAVILAGGPTPKSLLHLTAHRAVLPVGGRPIIALVADALARTPMLAAVVAVTPAATHAEHAGLPCPLVAAGGSIVENMRRGAAALADGKPTHLLFVTGDLPLLTPEAIAGFLADSLATGAALTYPIIPREASEARFPGARRTYVKIREGTFTGGNAVLTTAQLLDDKQDLIDNLYAGRKSPFKLAARAVITAFAELGFDVDKPGDLASVEAAWLSERTGG